MIPFKMMYNMSMSRHWFSSEQWGEGGALNHLPLSSTEHEGTRTFLILIAPLAL